MVEHCPEANAADIAVGRPIDRVTEGHIIGRHCLRDRPGSASNMKETPGHFLSRSDLGKGAVTLRIEINLERFFVRSHVHLGLHAFQDVGICVLHNRRLRASSRRPIACVIGRRAGCATFSTEDSRL